MKDMAQVIKLKESDLVKIVNNILESKSFDSSDITEVDTDLSAQSGDTPKVGKHKIQLGKDKKGNVYVINNETGEIMGVK